MSGPQLSWRRAFGFTKQGYPQHAIGKGRHRDQLFHDRKLVAITAAAALGLGTVLGGASLLLDLQDTTSAPSIAAQAQTVIMEVALPERDAQILQIAQTACDRFNFAALDTFALDDPVRDVLDAYEQLQEAIETADHLQGRALVLEGVPADVVDAYNSHDVPLRKLVGAAQSLETVDVPPEPAPQILGVEELELPKVTAPLAETSVAEILDKTERLDQAVQVLPVEERIAVAGEDAVDPAELSDEEIDRILASSEVPSVRVEKQRRFAASLPDLSSMENGRIDDALLCPVPWVSPYYRVLCAILPSLESLNAEFKEQFGHDLAVQSAYRSYEEQVMVHEVSPTMTTLPGTSNHSWGLAVDFDIDAYRSYEHPEVEWLVENAPRFGWRNPTLEAFGTSSEEPWHFEFGTIYAGLENSGFNGPTPAFEYAVKLPQGAQTQTLLSGQG